MSVSPLPREPHLPIVERTVARLGEQFVSRRRRERFEMNRRQVTRQSRSQFLLLEITQQRFARRHDQGQAVVFAQRTQVVAKTA